MSDNFRIDVSSAGRKHFELAMELAFSNAPGGAAVAYKIVEKPVEIQGFRGGSKTTKHLVLFWSLGESEKPTALAYGMKLDDAVAFAWGWLQNCEFPNQPDHDGDNSKGWRIYNEAWGHVDHSPYAFVGIEPGWMMHGK